MFSKPRFEMHVCKGFTHHTILPSELLMMVMMMVMMSTLELCTHTIGQTMSNSQELKCTMGFAKQMEIDLAMFLEWQRQSFALLLDDCELGGKGKKKES